MKKAMEPGGQFVRHRQSLSAGDAPRTSTMGELAVRHVY